MSKQLSEMTESELYRAHKLANKRSLQLVSAFIEAGLGKETYPDTVELLKGHDDGNNALRAQYVTAVEYAVALSDEIYARKTAK